MKKKFVFNFPLYMFILMEKSISSVWTSSVSSPNHYYFFLSKSWIYMVSLIFSKELYFQSSFLVENSAIDLNFLNSKKNFMKFHSKNKNTLLNFYSFYFYSLKLKLTVFLTSTNSFGLNSITSIDKVFKNANWVESETGEMYNMVYIGKNDTSKLLLDYSKDDYPLLKDFPSEGFTDVFFNFFEGQVYVNSNEVIEL